MLLLIAFVMFAILTIAWLVMPDKPAMPVTAPRTDVVTDPAIMPARA